VIKVNEIKDSKTKNSSRNLAFGIILKIYQLLLPFVIRTIIIKVLGMEYAGLNSLFASLMQTLNIAELGVGTALVFSMYKPIAEGNKERICALMKLYKIYYRVIGLVILVIGVSLTPFLPWLVKQDVPEDINLYILYFMNLGATVLSYWLFAYKNSLFLAHQRNDVASKVTLITNTIQYGLQIVLLFLFKNYYFYVIILLFTQVISNISIAFLADKYFPEYKAIGSLPKEERKKINGSIRDLFYGQLGLVVTVSVDSIVISAFLGLVPLGIYQNYYYIISALIGFFLIFYQSCRASIGTNILTKSTDENFKDFKFITFVIVGALGFCVSCLYNMFQPFIEIWVGKKNLLDIYCVALFCAYFFTYELSWLIGAYKDVSGKWHADRFRPLITAVVNLITNIILVNIIGIYGILISTIVAYWIINIPWLYRRVFIDVFEKEKSIKYFVFLCKKLIVFFIIVVACGLICSRIKLTNNFLLLIVNFGICLFVSVFVYLLCNFKTEEMSRAKIIMVNFLGKLKRRK